MKKQYLLTRRTGPVRTSDIVLRVGAMSNSPGRLRVGWEVPCALHDE
jgi:hypothetical protein